MTGTTEDDRADLIDILTDLGRTHDGGWVPQPVLVHLAWRRLKIVRGDLRVLESRGQIERLPAAPHGPVWRRMVYWRVTPRQRRQR